MYVKQGQCVHRGVCTCPIISRHVLLLVPEEAAALRPEDERVMRDVREAAHGMC